jgi:hypothetical protein
VQKEVGGEGVKGMGVVVGLVGRLGVGGLG